MNSGKVRMSLRLPEEEREILRHCAERCGLSQSAFLRQLCRGKTPRPKPPREFWDMLNALYEVHDGFQKCAEYEPSAAEICKEIERLILDLQEVV